MRNTIKALYYEKGKNRKLYLAGHSLGGALATIAAGHLAFGENMDIAGIYTIGSPRLAITTSVSWISTIRRVWSV